VPPRDIRVEQPEGAGVVALIGEHDAFGADGLRRELELLLATGKPVVVDLTEATFIDSSTVGVLLTVFRECAEAGLTLGLVLPSATTGPHVRRLIETTQLDEVFPIHESLAAALEAAQHAH
jgi:anti-anti-sigma factor